MSGVDLARTQSYFDGRAPEWDERMGPDADQCRIIEAELDRLGIGAEDQVLDAGCGTGVLFPFLKSRIAPPGCIYALDLSAEMLAEARRKHGAEGIRYLNREVLAFTRAEPAGWVDEVVCFSAFPHFPEKEQLLGGFHRLLKGGGRLLIFHLQSSRRINEIHAGLPDEHIRTHTLPPVHLLERQAADSGFAVLHRRDGEEGYCLLAEKGRQTAP